ncbi:MAG TPA: hypothetical protein VE631_00415, partial [Alphaproteobacteria bacterium]|nr:hypothetical protein [Alphaproteobacteria bacterium]
MPRPEPAPLAAAIAVTLGLFSAAALAGDGEPHNRLHEIEQQLEHNRAVQQQSAEEAAALEREIEGLKQRLVAAAHKAQEREQAASQAEARLAELHQQEFQLKARLQAQQDDLSTTLMALTRLQRQPAVLLLAQGDDPVRSLRTRRLLSLAARELDARTRTVRGELRQLAALRDELGAERRSLDGAQDRLQASREALDQL